MADPLTATASVASTALNSFGAHKAGQAESRAANIEAGQMESIARSERASSQQQALAEQRRGELVKSRAIAVSAAGGGGVSDTNIIGDIEAEKKFRSLAALFEGEERARDLEKQANITRFTGRQARKAGNIKAVTSAISGGSTLFQRYGGSS